MPASKLAFLRYSLIDRMILDKFKPYPSKEEILEVAGEQFGVKSPSTIEKDLQAMREEFDAPIAYSKKQKGYYYTDPNFKLLKVNLSEDNLKALQFVESFLEEFKTFPIFNQFKDAVNKVLDGLQLTQNFKAEGRTMNSFMQLEQSEYVKGSEKLSDLVQLIADRKVLLLEYKKFGQQQSKEYTIHPYLLKEFRNLWYLTGYVEEYKEARTFGVDRIVDYVPISRQQYIPENETGFNSHHFFQNCFGITALNEKPQRIVLSFNPYQGNYLKTKPLHQSQEILVDDDSEFRIELYLVDNYELRSQILSYGSTVKVISPKSLVSKIREEVAAAAKNYASK